MPVIGPSSKADGVFHAFGFSVHGFQLSPIVGRIMAGLILDDKADLSIGPFDIQRFNITEDEECEADIRFRSELFTFLLNVEITLSF